MNTRTVWRNSGVVIAVAALVTLIAASLPVNAPAVVIEQSYVFRNILTDSGDGDLLVFARGELPLAGWCSELEDSGGCPTDPSDPTSLAPSKAYLRLLKSCTGPAISDCVIVGETPLRRVGPFLAGIYLDIAHGVTWGANDVRVCVVAPTSAFDTEESSCAPADWRPDAFASSSTTRPQGVTQLTSDLIALMKNYEVARLDPPGYLVDAEKVTLEGLEFAEEAFTLIGVAAPNAFKSGAVPADVAFEDFTISTPAAEDYFATQQAGSGFLQGANEITRDKFGLEIQTFGRWLTVGSSVVLALFMAAIVRNPLAVVIGMEVPWVAGVWLWVPFSWLGVMLVLSVLAISALVASRLPQ